MIVEIVISEIDFLIKENIRYSRIKAGFDQVKLAQKIGVSEGYIGNIENQKNSAKANTRMIARIANALKINSYLEIMPKQVVKNDIVRLKLDLFDINTRNQVLDEEGKVPERLKILSKVILTDKEYNIYKEKKMPYCTVIKT
ncbi:MAG: helix-turn-helix transcriptional regulator [Aequorivita antarctica]